MMYAFADVLPAWPGAWYAMHACMIYLYTLLHWLLYGLLSGLLHGMLHGLLHAIRCRRLAMG